MKILVVYDTKHGNTRKIAEEIASAFGADHQAHLKRVAEAEPQDVASADVLVLGCPTHAWSPTPATKDFLKRLKGTFNEGKHAAAFDTKLSSRFAGSAARKLEKSLSKLGFQIAAPRLSAIVSGMKGPLGEGQIEKAREFAAAILAGISDKPES